MIVKNRSKTEAVPVKATTKADWLWWLHDYGAAKFLDAFLESVEGAESVCVHCGERIYVDVLIGGGVPDWSTASGDFGCYSSPDTDENGTGGHVPRKRKG